MFPKDLPRDDTMQQPALPVLAAPPVPENATEVKVEESSEKWCDFKLSDGTEVRVKVTILNAYRSNNDLDTNGSPVYFFGLAPLVTVNVNPDLLKKT